MSVQLWAKTKVLILNDMDGTVISMFREKGCNTSFIGVGTLVHDSFLEKFDLMVFCGGTDISPNIYSDSRDFRTDTSDSIRDSFEIDMVQRAIRLGLGIIGICRGAQLISCHLGGSLVQHDKTGKHLSSHDLILEDSTLLENASASHHQIMLPPKCMDVIGYFESDCEVAVHKDYGALCYQPHPEWEDSGSVNREVFFDLVLEYCI